MSPLLAFCLSSEIVDRRRSPAATHRNAATQRTMAAEASTPPEFSKDYVSEASPQDVQMYDSLLNSGEPYKSLNVPNTHVSNKVSAQRRHHSEPLARLCRPPAQPPARGRGGGLSPPPTWLPTNRPSN